MALQAERSAVGSHLVLAFGGRRCATSDELQKNPETPPNLRWPMGLSGRGFGVICLLLGVAIMAANVTSLVVLQRYWRWGFVLPPALFFSGLVLVMLPERLTRLDSGSKGAGSNVVGALLLIAL